MTENDLDLSDNAGADEVISREDATRLPVTPPVADAQAKFRYDGERAKKDMNRYVINKSQQKSSQDNSSNS